MMKMKKKFFPVFLALMMLVMCLFALAACGGGSSVTGKYTNPSIATDIYELKSDAGWSHGEEKGTYSFNSETNKVIFKQGDTEVATGTIKDGVLTIGTATYKKASPGFFQKYGMYLILAVVVLLFIVYFFFSSRKNKRRRQEYAEQIEAIRPGNKIKTTGGICGVVVEVCDDDTVVLETGTEQSGKSYVKIDKECIYQTDAKGPTQIAREEAEAKRRAEKEAKDAAKRGEAPAEPETPAEEPAETPAEPAEPETPAEPTEPEEKKE